MQVLDINTTRTVREFDRIDKRESMRESQCHMSGKAIARADMVDTLDGRFIGWKNP